MANLGLNRMFLFDDWAKASGATADERKRVKERVSPILSDSRGDLYQETTLDRALEIVRVEIHRCGAIPESPHETARALAMVAEAMHRDREERKQQHDEQNNHLTAITSMVAANLPRRPDTEQMTTQDVGDALACGSANVIRMLKAGTIPDNLLVPGTDKKGRQKKFKRRETEAWLKKYLASKANKSAGNSTRSTARKKTTSTKPTR